MQLFQSWSEIGRIVVTALLVYAALILYVRLAGIRSISKMNNFDWVVTVALGSMLGSVILLKDVVLMDGLVAIFMLLGTQYVVVKVSTRFDTFRHAVHAQPVLLLYNGHFLEDVMHRERVMEGEVLSAIRKDGHSDLSKITAVVLEPDASFSVITHAAALDSPLFEQVKRPDMS